MKHELGGGEKNSAMFFVNDAGPLLRNPALEMLSPFVRIPGDQAGLCEKIMRENR
jgi:hypothetical protein